MSDTNNNSLHNKENPSPVAAREEEILRFWKENKIFEKTLEKDAPKGEFVFYEGPPTANNHPAIHHLEARAFKDLLPRYKTMQGFHVRRKAGWDTHGLPVELEVEKELGLKNKKDIEAYGIEAFNKKCKESVLRYIGEWKEFTERIGFWVDHDQTYFTFANTYIESVWNIIQKVHERGLLYKDYRVVPWCARCGTPLSSHEVADGYKDVVDTSVIAEFRVVGEDNTAFLAWTTTPWTLPGNVALAVGPDIEYVIVEKKDEGGGDVVRFILAKDLAESVFGDEEYTVVETKKGSELVGMEYESLFPYLKESLPEEEKEKAGNAFKVYAAPFVTTEDGTGIVHSAVMYGQDDFELGTQAGLPKHHLVGEDGMFTSDAGELAGVFVKDADERVIAMLKENNQLFSTHAYEHTYPHCWRCKNPLIYYARDSWFIKMSQLREELVKENQEIHWEPEHIRDGRFGEWLRDVKDWAISRNRYWGTPLPVWTCDACNKVRVIGSRDELYKNTQGAITKFIVLRHGESEKNTRQIFDDSEDGYGLTEKGREQSHAVADILKNENIAAMYATPVRRTKETADIIGKELGIEYTQDPRITEIDSGEWDGHPREEVAGSNSWNAYYALSDEERQYAKRGNTGESWADVEERTKDFLEEVQKKHAGKTVVIVTHQGTVTSMHKILNNLSVNEIVRAGNSEYWARHAYPHMMYVDMNTGKGLDVHRPYIDAFNITCECGAQMNRAEEVLDVWFDSGAMPFAQDHYPFENKEWVEGDGYPADFISEAIDQTRGWFYTLHAIGILMGRGKAYKNVICLGHLLDNEGKKMSKSIGNVIDPWEMIPKYGVDALRFWMYTVNEPGNSKNFDERTVDEIVKKNITRFLNVVSFYNLYAENNQAESSEESPHVLDRWIISRLHELIQTTTANLDAYKIDRAARPIVDFIDDLSTWYIRRSRDRFKGDDMQDKERALHTTRYILLTFSKVLAPFMPFVSEYVYRHVGGKQESVHLEQWPERGETDKEMLSLMNKTREVVTSALEARTNAGIKVRQPLAQLTIRAPLNEELRGIIADEVNVKEVVVNESSTEEVVLDTAITPELQKEGDMRELVRAIQGARKNAGLSPDDKIILVFDCDDAVQELIKEYWRDIASLVRATDKSFSGLEEESGSAKLSVGTARFSLAKQ